jgi:hypothetical protein
MKITDIIRQVLDIVDSAEVQPEVEIAVEPIGIPQPDEVAIISALAGVPEPEYANEPCEVTAPIGAAFPGGDDMHQRKNPADIRTNAPSMYPGYQAK